MRIVASDLRHAVLVVALAAGCRFTANHPVEIESSPLERDGALFDSALSRARQYGYVEHEVDERRRFASFQARFGDVSLSPVWGGYVLSSNVNYFMMQVVDGGRLKVWAAGPEVRGDRIDKNLEQELELFAARIAGYDVKVVRGR